MLALALVGIVLHLLDLFQVFPATVKPHLLWANLVIDLAFVVDFALKLTWLGRRYVNSAWFVVDLVSTLPVLTSLLDLLQVFSESLAVARLARLVRIMRIVRSVRVVAYFHAANVAKSIRQARGLGFVRPPQFDLAQTPAFDRAVRWSVPLFVVALLLVSQALYLLEVRTLARTVRQHVHTATTIDDIARLNEYRGEWKKEYEVLPYIAVTVTRGDRERTLAFDLSQGVINAERAQGLLLLLTLVAIGSVAWIMGAMQADQGRSRDQQLLDQCFSPVIVNTFSNTPQLIEAYSRRWMTVFFIDIKGFTATCEKHRKDIEGLALRLRRIMDIARGQIVERGGVIDKFIGDGVMGWLGGPFSPQWQILAGLRKQLLKDEIEELENDIFSLERELDLRRKATSAGAAAATEPFASATDLDLPQIERALSEVRTRLAALSERQRQVLAANPDLEHAFAAAFLEYRRQIAREALLCLLAVAHQVDAIDDPDGFHEVKIGVASGSMGLGNFGATQQVGYSVLGSVVNLASRLEPAAGQSGCRVLTDEATYEVLTDCPDLVFRRWGRMRPKGIASDINVYEPLRRHAANEQIVSHYHDGLTALENHDFAAAVTHFKRADAVIPSGDLPSRLRIEQIEAAMAAGTPVALVYHPGK